MPAEVNLSIEYHCMWNDITICALVLAVVDIALKIGVTVHAVLWKRDSRAVISWVGLAWLAPLLGSLAYFCLGINRIQRKAVALQVSGAESRERIPALTAEDDTRIETFSREHPNLLGLARLGFQLTGQHVVPGNQVQPLIDGDEAYPAMIDAIGDAQRTVALLSYIFDSDRAGDAFLEALVAAQERSVEIRVLVDDVGARYSRPNILRRLQKAGIHNASFLPTRIPRLPQYANLRNHRKILVVDGQVGFTGGTNIREGHWLALDPKQPVQCVHFRLQGPVVADLQHTFAVDWAFATRETLSGSDWYPKLQRQGPVWARGISHGPDEDFEKMADLIAGALASARRRVRIVTPYFLPSASLIQTLNVAAMRGVEIEIFVPARSNIALVQWAATAQMWQLLSKGCRIYSTASPFDHTKLMVVDDVWCLIGSTNWDPRSLRLNFEFNVECYDEQLSRSLNDIIDKKASQSQAITLDEVNGRNLPVRLRDGLARLLTPYL